MRAWLELFLVGGLCAWQTKLILRWVYYWQLKEYRRDAMKLEMSSPVWIDRLMPTAVLYRPVLTAKAKLVTGLSLLLGWCLLGLSLYQGPIWLSVGVVLSSPLLVGGVIGLLLPLDRLIKRQAIAQAKAKLDKQKGLIVIGVTGSYGKTSTKEILKILLSEKYRVLATPKNFNTMLGVTKTINDKLNADQRIFIVEMGAYRRGEIREICELVKPKIGVLTGLGNQHLGMFGSSKNLIDAKSELAEALPKGGLMVLNKQMKKEWQIQKRTEAKVKKFANLTSRQSDLLNQLNIPQSNVQAAITVAKYLGLNNQQLETGFNKLLKANLSRKYDFVKTANGYTVIYDDYNSNLLGFTHALSVLKKQPGNRKIVITSGVRELGPAIGDVHRELSKQMLGWVNEVIVTQPGYTQLFEREGLRVRNLKGGGLKKWLEAGGLKKGDVVLVEGKQSVGFRELFQ